MPKIRSQPLLGVVVVTYNAADVILDCLESLLAAPDVALHIVVVDNASTDGTVERIRGWAGGGLSWRVPDNLPFPLTPAPKPVPIGGPGETDAGITLIESGVNAGFAAGVNRGLACLADRPGIDRFWVLNPDSVVPPGTPRAFATWPEPAGGFGLLGGRVNYLEPPEMIQSDGGRINWLTGVTSNIGFGQDAATAPPPDPAAIEFISGASVVASRAFYERAGPMPEDFFLYYEEVAWALRCGAMPLCRCPEAVVHHRAGSSIGSPTAERMASPFSIYFMFRARMRFMRLHRPAALPVAYLYALAKAMHILGRGHGPEARAMLRAIHAMGPPASVRDRFTPEAARLAFGRG